MITTKASLRSGFHCIIRPAPSGAGRTTHSQARSLSPKKLEYIENESKFLTYLHIMLIFHTDMREVAEILPHIGQGSTYFT